ncbi:MAG: amino acid ABC transporter ATP-binding protein [Peptoniphilaceae bacterium]|nr:amino acid ABC transporter ATP-binding protein [Peptoniphilaceae bacterium]MDY5766594.1 amino acid ABC transporter ATP-binding protein [Peptoniphilaceae bacterium]
MSHVTSTKEKKSLILDVRHLAKRFGDHAVLKDVSMVIEAKEVIALLGPSGSGKSTLLRCLNLLEKPMEGEILFHGQSILQPNLDSRRYCSKVGMVFQHFNLFSNMTVLGNCILGQMKVLHRSREEAKEKALFYLQKVGMAEYIDAKPAQISGGQKQRVAIARSLAMDPEVLLFDEPTSALDPQNVAEVMNVIRDLADEGMTMVVVTHETNFAKNVANGICFLQNGVILERGDPQEMFADPKTPEFREFLSIGM